VTASGAAQAAAQVSSGESRPVTPAPRVEMLGPIRIVGARGVVPPVAVRGRAAELAAFLAMYRDLGPGMLPRWERDHMLPPMGGGADLDLVYEALWGGTTVREVGVGIGVRRARVARAARLLRSWLGWHPDTRQPYLPPYTEAGGFRLHPAITTDWAHWHQILPANGAGADGPGRENDGTQGRRLEDVGTADLQAAWSLVRGRLLHTARRRSAPLWADDLVGDMHPRIYAVGEELATRHLSDGNLVAAVQVAGHGLRIDPYMEETWRPLITTVAAALDLTRSVDSHDVSRVVEDETQGRPEGISAEDWRDWIEEDRAQDRRRATHGPLDAVVWAMLECQSEGSWSYLHPGTRRLLADLDYPPPDDESVELLSYRIPTGEQPGHDHADVARYAVRTALKAARAAQALRTGRTSNDR
jgi:hypothetical protein